MGGRQEKLPSVPVPSLFDPIPKKLRPDEEWIRSSFDGSIGSYGIIMVLNPITGTPIRAIFVDLFGQAGKMAYEPLERAKWASPNRDIQRGTPEHDKLDAIAEAVREKWLAWRAVNPRHGPMREFRVPHSPKLPRLVLIEPEILHENRKSHKDEHKKKGPVSTSVNMPQAVRLTNSSKSVVAPQMGYPGYTSPALIEKTDRENAAIYRKLELRWATMAKKRERIRAKQQKHPRNRF